MVRIEMRDGTFVHFNRGVNFTWPKGQLVVYGAWGEILRADEMRRINHVEGTFQPPITVHHVDQEWWVTEDEVIRNQ